MRIWVDKGWRYVFSGQFIGWGWGHTEDHRKLDSYL